MKWKYTKPLKSTGFIKEFERHTGFELPLSYQKQVLSINGGRPEKYCFKTESGKERTIKRLLSLSRDDLENAWDLGKWVLDCFNRHFIPFAIDSFGNYICFDQIGAVLFVSHDPLEYEFVACDFDEFLKALY